MPKRFLQRFENYEKALDELKEEVYISSEKPLSNLEKKGIIQSFEIVQELAWKVIKDFYTYVGETSIQGSRDAFLLAVNRGLISSECGKKLMQSIKSRNLTSHTYDEKIAEEIFISIINDYYDAFEELRGAFLDERFNRKI
jgi:nucleotidyltransferase substrate binding protein (TIGR01987 family)